MTANGTGSAARQLGAIHTMLAAGQRNLRIERHTLVLWGLAGGLLFLFSEHILTPTQFPVVEQRATAWLLLISVVLGAVGIADWHLTRRAKAARDEAWSFIHRQVLKILWLLMSIGTLLTFAMFFFGGGYMVCAAWLVLIGISLYVHGLFSEELLEWAGALVIVTGIASLGFHLAYETMKWISASVFGIGLPLLALMLDRGRSRPAWQRSAQSTLWIVLVLTPPLLAQRYAAGATLPDAPVVSLASYRQHEAGNGAKNSAENGARIIALPAGSAIPVDIELSGDLFRKTPVPTLPLTLAEPVELMMIDGQLTGDMRFPGEPWLRAREVRWIGIPWLKAELTPEQGPLIRSSLVVDVGPQRRTSGQ
ncbi:MAG: hypothetical protein WAZ34_02405 [Rhodocyclaceae bacterium]